jgi:hypothetical protein
VTSYNGDIAEMFKNKSIIILNNQLRLFYGSELHSLHIAEYFQHIDFDVTLAAWHVDDPFLSIAESKGIETLEITANRCPFQKAYDIVWTHHLTTFFFVHVVNPLVARHYVHGCLSSFLEIESVPISNNFDLSQRLTILANSVETKDVIRQKVKSTQEIKVLLNVVPKEFYSYKKTDYGDIVRKVIIVSNHVPPELREVVPLLEKRGVSVDIIGIEDNHRFVDHLTLLDYDVVITIGKTVQFALAQAVPVFVYDHFGGPGYLDKKGIKRHEDFNFSGRSSPEKLTSNELLDSILNGYPRAVDFARYASKQIAPKYTINFQMEQLDGKLSQLNGKPTRLLSRIERVRLLKHFCSRHHALFLYFLALWFSSLYVGFYGWYCRPFRPVYSFCRFTVRRFFSLRKNHT